MKKKRKPKKLNIIKKAEELSSYVLIVTDSAPKKFRFSLISKLQNNALDVKSKLEDANDTFIDLKILKDLDKSIKYAEKQLEKTDNFLEKLSLENKILTLKLTRVNKLDKRIEDRLSFQYQALNILKDLDHLTTVSREMKCLTYKHQEHIASLIEDIKNMLYKWIESDRKRFNY